MDRQEIINQVEELLVSVLKHNDFVMTEELMATHVDGWDSLTHMVIITNIEDKFGIKFRLKELNKMKNMGSLLDLIVAKI